MALTNNNKKQVDLPVWEWLRFAPANTSSLTSLTTSRDGSSRYLFYFNSSILYRYDTVGDTWQQLSTGIVPVQALSVQYVNNQGFGGNILEVPTSTTLRIPSVNTSLNGYTIKITGGTGNGQKRTITNTGNEIIHDSGLVTTVTTSVITDTLKRWSQNQWVGYSLKLIYNTGFSQYREILYNDQTTATIYDANYEGRNFLTAPFNTNAPYGTPNATAGTQSHFIISSQIITVDSPWTIAPDTTSQFEIESGGIWWISSNASTPFYNFYYYDIISDRWVVKLTPTGLIPAALGTDFSFTPLSDKLLGELVTSTVTSATSKTVTDTTLNLINGRYTNYHLKITGGTGIGQERRILSNTDNQFVVAVKWNIIPDDTSTYSVSVRDNMFLVGNARSQMLRYSPYYNVWTTSNIIEGGIVSNLVITRSNKLQYGVSTATIASAGIRTINTTPTVGGINYQVGDILTVSTGGSLGRVRVESIHPITGDVLTISLYTAGNTYTIGTGKSTTGGSGSGCTVEILTVGNIGLITTPINNDIKIGESITFNGANLTTTTWNGTYTILGVQSQVILEVIPVSGVSVVPFYTLGTNLLQDLTKNWVVNEFAGRLLGIQSNGITGTITWRKIIGNSSNTISFVTGVAPTCGNSRYFIQDLPAFGKDVEYLSDDKIGYGFSTSGSVSVLNDTSKDWSIGAYNGNKIRLTNTSNGVEVEDFVSSNTTTVLNIGRTVAVGNGTSNSIAYSNDNGLTWIGVNKTIFTTQGNSVCWNGSIFVAVGSGTNTIAYSYDGLTWNGLGVTIFGTSGNDVCWNGTRFVAVGSGTNTIAYSNNGITWVAGGATTFTTSGNSVCWNGSKFLAGGLGTNIIAYSVDGITWSATTNGNTIFTGGTVFSICWNGTIFVAVGSGTSNKIGYSSDGLTWTASTNGNTIFTTQVNDVTWNGTRFVAVGSGTNTVSYSSDGNTWTASTSGNSFFNTSGFGVCWNGVYFVAVGSTTNTFIYSSDGITWFASATGTALFNTSGFGVSSTTPFVSITPNLGIVPSVNTYYEIQDTFGTAIGTQSTTQLQDITKKWKVNQWAGKKVIFTSGTGVSQELLITSNTSNALTFGVSTAPDSTTTYTILGRPSIGAGIQLMWNYGTTDTQNKGKYLISPRGSGSHTFDIYDITTNRWDYGDFILGQGYLLNIGTMYSYDSQDKIYYQVNSLGVVMCYDIVKKEISTLGTVPYGMSTAILSNRMEIIQTVDGLKYLYIMRHTGTEMWRMLIF